MTPRSLLHPAQPARKPVLSTQSDERLVDLVLPPERAEDAVQQTLVNAHEAIRRDDAEIKLRPWHYLIAHNTALNGPERAERAGARRQQRRDRGRRIRWRQRLGLGRRLGVERRLRL